MNNYLPDDIIERIILWKEVKDAQLNTIKAESSFLSIKYVHDRAYENMLEKHNNYQNSSTEYNKYRFNIALDYWILLANKYTDKMATLTVTKLDYKLAQSKVI